MTCTTCIKHIAKHTIKHTTNIVEGWYYVLNKDEVVEDFAKVRLDICRTCPDLLILVKTKRKLGGICKHCGCPPISKARVKDEHCKLNNW
jgi:hypothetical protein